jgi:hypothetical protein
VFVSYQAVRNAMMVGGFLFLTYLVYAWYSTERIDPRLASFDPQSVSPVPVQDAAVDGISMGTEGNGEMVRPLLNSSDSSGSSAGSSGDTVSDKTTASNVNALVAAPPASQAASQVKNSSENGTLLASAMKIATSASKPGAGKDVLGASSPWKLNLYDDNADGQWDRGKLDFNRDDVDDEKWNFKEGRWEKEGGHEIWNGTAWQSSDAPATTGATTGANTVASTAAPAKPATPAAPVADEALTNYRAAMKIATAKAVKGKGKDVLGSRSKWKLNLYDDNNDGQWDRGKLDTNRDEVDDEKWNFKQGRWEKDGGAKIWNGENWVSP